MAPFQLPTKRRRALTLPLPVGRPGALLRKKQSTQEQLQSHLFKLPLELRQLVYEEAFRAGNPDFIISLLPRRKKLYHICGRERDWSEPWTGHRGPMHCANHSHDGFLALLRTCRVLYTEAVNLLYSKPTFLFQDPQDIVLFASTILPQRLDAIQSVELAWDGAATRYFRGTEIARNVRIGRILWYEAWDVMARMKGLRELRVRLKPYSLIGVLGPAKSVVQPMKRMRGVKVQMILPPDEFPLFENPDEEPASFELVEETMLEKERW